MCCQFHVNPINAAPDIHNPADPVSGFAAIPRNMTGIGTKMSAAGYKVGGHPRAQPCRSCPQELTVPLTDHH
jgi:hypothetical protein